MGEDRDGVAVGIDNDVQHAWRWVMLGERYATQFTSLVHPYPHRGAAAAAWDLAAAVRTAGVACAGDSGCSPMMIATNYVDQIERPDLPGSARLASQSGAADSADESGRFDYTDPPSTAEFSFATLTSQNGGCVTVDLVAHIGAVVAQRRPVNGIRIVGIDGRSGSGKSFLAARLSARMAAPIIEIDDFVSWDCFAGWWPRFDTQVLTPLLAGRDATFQARDWTDWYGSSLGAWKTQPWSPTIILEGVTCTRRESIGRITCAIWVEAPASLRLARGMARDSTFAGKEELWRRWMIEEDEFFVADGTRDRADIIVDTSTDGATQL